jgi:uncharacterized membrane protein
MSATTLRRGNLVLLAGWIGACITIYPRLPERIPLHFGFAGGADAWTGSSMGIWLLMPAIGAVVVLFGYALSGVAARTPEMWNLRQEEVKRVRALPSHVQEELAEAGRRSTAWILILTTVALMGVQVGVYATAVGQTERMPWYAQAIIWSSLAAIVLLSLREGSRLRWQIRAGSSEPQAADGANSPPR